ncbi:glucose-6-phosphate dehydrogenase [Tautonia plasticadhaerens]|uniref:Glucose-6-phosphate 1-dehydrogenase n=1 Tax=Tautonia plasticadhaerens TaxID=2527974 RepID=A0A518H372_9BACT|nr:glucose-6-phosphate dehydrogenase [Tautonia plasticadhaerens]QDV35277.1 Glucose-6-phosphate 1-dehydrogenase [Tautonia plasticadhaerens]
MAPDFVIFGAAGDLTSRYLMPALARLDESGQLPKGVTIRGVSQEDWDVDRFRRHIADRLATLHEDIPPGVVADLIKRLDYRQADVTNRDEVAEALGKSRGPVVAYLALPPRLFGPTIETLAGLDLPEGSRLVVEKPFGSDVESAKRLNRLLHESFPEQSVFRVDHFLMKATIQNVIGLRFANRIFEMLWNRDNIERVEITWDETVALEGRASYYDRSGALRDMIQNHLLQLLTLVGMEPPVTMSERDLRDRKVELLRAVRNFTPEEVERHTARARYAAGTVKGVAVPNYVDEPGVDPDRKIETFAQVTLFVDNWRWAGVPFVLRSGKALASDRHEIVVHYRPVPHLAFHEDHPQPNVLRFQLNPDRMSLGMNINGPGDPLDLERVELATDCCQQEIPAYSRLLLDVIKGDPILAIRGDEAEESWRIVEPILHAWAEGRVPMRDYPAGSDGPDLG